VKCSPAQSTTSPSSNRRVTSTNSIRRDFRSRAFRRVRPTAFHSCGVWPAPLSTAVLVGAALLAVAAPLYLRIATVSPQKLVEQTQAL
jgi:hypothetical protein